MVNVPNVTLNNGEKMPAFGLGTFEVCLKIFHFCGHEIEWKILCHVDRFYYVPRPFVRFIYTPRCASIYDATGLIHRIVLPLDRLFSIISRSIA